MRVGCVRKGARDPAQPISRFVKMVTLPRHVCADFPRAGLGAKNFPKITKIDKLKDSGVLQKTFSVA